MTDPTHSAASTPRRWLRWLLIPIIAGAALLAALSQAGSATHGHVPPPPTSLGTVVNEALPAIPLIDAQGRSTSLAALRGKTVVLADFMTSCQEQCPITTGALDQLRRQVNQAGLTSKIAIVEVTIDPQRDTPARLRAYTALTTIGVPLLTGRTQDLDALWRFLGIYIRKVPQGHPPNPDWLTGHPYTYDLQHQDGVFFLDPHGRERFVIAGPANVNGALPPKLAKLLDPLGRQNLQTPAPESWNVPDLATVLHWLTGTTLPA